MVVLFLLLMFRGGGIDVVDKVKLFNIGVQIPLPASKPNPLIQGKRGPVNNWVIYLRPEHVASNQHQGFSSLAYFALFCDILPCVRICTRSKVISSVVLTQSTDLEWIKWHEWHCENFNHRWYPQPNRQDSTQKIWVPFVLLDTSI